MNRDSLIASLSDAFGVREDREKKKEQKIIKERCEQVQHAIDMGFLTEEDVYKRLQQERNKK